MPQPLGSFGGQVGMGPVGSVIAVCVADLGAFVEAVLEAPNPVSARKRTMPRKKVDSIVYFLFGVELKISFG
jgi:hypothetical protein